MSLFSEFREDALKRADQVRLLKQKIEGFEPFTVPPGIDLTTGSSFLPSRSERLTALRERAARAARGS